MLRSVPSTASIAHDQGGGRLFAPSAERNAPVLTKLLCAHAPEAGEALELASGTGQHVASYAAAMPGLTWQPSELDAERRNSIEVWTDGLDNVLPPVELDAGAPGWSADHGGKALIVLANLLHLIPEDAAKNVISEAAKALAPAGKFILYGPFLRGGEATSEGDARFHASLSAHDPEIGYKDDSDIRRWMEAAGLTITECAQMPANNLAFVAQLA